MTSPEQVAAEAMDAAFKAKNGMIDDIIRIAHVTYARVVISALRDTGYLIEGGESDYAIVLVWQRANDPALVFHTVEAARAAVASYQRCDDTGDWSGAKIVKRAVSWRPVEEETNE